MVGRPLDQTPPSQPGTPESDWQDWGTEFPVLDLEGCTRLVVVAPHPDDEILGIGGLMASCVQRGLRVEIVSVTDGEAARVPWLNLSPTSLASARRAEVVEALEAIGIAEPPVRLGLPDGDVAAHERTLATDLALYLATASAGTWCLTTWRHDGHPDHDAVGRACARACRGTGVRLVEFPVWMWHWATPADPAVPWHRARSFRLPQPHHDAKNAAVRCFRSQTSGTDDQAILPPHVLARLTRSRETVFV